MRSLFLYGFSLALLLVVATGVWFGLYVKRVPAGQGETVIFVPKGTGVRQIRTLLGDQGLIYDDVRFLILARLTGLAGRLRAGEYRISYGLSPLQVLQVLEEGKVVRHWLTIPEGLNIQQVAELLAANGWVNKERFLELLSKPAFIRTVGLQEASLEGYLFPDTYTLVRGEASEKTIIVMMVKRFHAIWREVAGKLKSDLSRHQVITLASLVEKETGAPEERALIAAIFLNRLGRGMRLQSDPTVLYGLADAEGPPNRADLRRETPYNTYVIKGLPPGPICNPGRAAILAALQPAETPYLYFVSKNDRTHYFSKTLQEHNRAVKKYQQ